MYRGRVASRWCWVGIPRHAYAVPFFLYSMKREGRGEREAWRSCLVGGAAHGQEILPSCDMFAYLMCRGPGEGSRALCVEDRGRGVVRCEPVTGRTVAAYDLVVPRPAMVALTVSDDLCSRTCSSYHSTGAGNQVAVVGCDILHKLLTDDEVVVVKTNPVNDYVGPLLRKWVCCC